jgi:hypothetical protein
VKPTFEQRERIRRAYARWRETTAPCGIPHEHPYNPCLPEEAEGRLECLTCGLRQRLELEAA